MPKDAVDLVSDDEEEKKGGEAPSKVRMIEGEVEERPEYVYNRFLGQYVKISPAELALQEQEKAKRKAYLMKKQIQN